MSTEKEWCTTGRCDLHWERGILIPSTVPMPEGDGWELISVQATSDPETGDTLFYTWCRVVEG